MKLDSFKSLLIKKAEGNTDLQTLIRLISHDILAEEIIESLEKMASSKGNKANSALTSFAGGMTEPDIHMLHDAISHHISHAAAINKEHPPTMAPITHDINVTDHRDGGVQKTRQFDTQKVDMHPLATKHIETAMKLANIAAKSRKWSMGKMSFDHVPPNAWEMNHTSDHTRANSKGHIKFADDQQGLKRKLDNNRFPNHGYLMLTPHPSSKNKGKLRGNEGQYPFEEMKINDKHIVIDPAHYGAIDSNGKAPTKYTPHAFESHPLLQKEGKNETWSRPEDDRSDADRSAYAAKLNAWQETPEFTNWLDKQGELEQKDPAKYEAHGASRSAPLFEGVKRSSVPSAQQGNEADDDDDDEDGAPTQQAVSQPKPDTVLRRPASAPVSAPVSAPASAPANAPATAAPAAPEHPRAKQIRAKLSNESPEFQKVLHSYMAGDPKVTKALDALPDELKRKWGII